MNIRRTLVALAFAVFAANELPIATAQDITLTVNRDTNAVSITNGEATVGDVSAYTISSASGALNPTNWNSLAPADDWSVAGTPSVNSLSELKGPGSTPVGILSPVALGTPFDPVAAQLAAGFGVDVEDIEFTFFDPVRTETFTPDVIYVGEKIFNSLVLNIDLATGDATIENESPIAVGLQGYVIGSALGELNSTWDGIRAIDATNWLEAGTSSANSLAELNQNPNTAALALAAGATVNLGSVYTGDGNNQDLTFDFTIQGNAEPFSSVVKYNGTPPSSTDTDNDGDVDGADFLALQRDNPSLIPNWELDYPGGALGASAAAVPEPTSIVLSLFGVVALGAWRRAK